MDQSCPGATRMHFLSANTPEISSVLPNHSILQGADDVIFSPDDMYLAIFFSITSIQPTG